MDYIDQFINNINKLRSEQYENFSLKEKNDVLIKKDVNTNTIEFRSFKSKMIKKALMDKMKPSNIGCKEYESNNVIDILEDDIFKTNVDNSEEEKMNIQLLPVERRLELINDFLERKNVVLDDTNMNKIKDIINDENILLKKYINVSNVYQHITKISFIKKLEDGTYIVDVEFGKTKKSKNHFFK